MNIQADNMSNGVEILIVEDSRTQAAELSIILKRRNYRTAIARDGKKALEWLNERKPALVISDIIMPEMDGYELCRQISNREDLKGLTVILLTSLSDARDVIKGLECGAGGFIVKPYRENYLLQCIQRALTNGRDQEEKKQPPPIEIGFASEKYLITADRQQILNLLLSTYEMAVQRNSELVDTQDELRALNASLEKRVEERTAELRIEIAERCRAEGALREKNEEVRTMSQQLWQSAKLATMGELAASIAHELNNPMATVCLRIEALQSQILPDDPKQQTLNIIEQELDRMANLVANLLQFSRRSHQQISTIDVCEEIEKTLELIHYHLRNHRITVVREFSPDVPAIHADRQQLRQLFLNLCTNASDAMPQGGTLTLRVVKAAGVHIEVRDTGEGISPENLQKVMDPFFTTKPEGKGTGLGLPICRRIAQEHGGEFEITSEVGLGTTVRISFPLKHGMNGKCL
ncbi:MAG: response regulator [Deltaproteobacteria bacterium]|nr:response regulator [Deltaproteobacteria bacterium]